VQGRLAGGSFHGGSPMNHELGLYPVLYRKLVENSSLSWGQRPFLRACDRSVLTSARSIVPGRGSFPPRPGPLFDNYGSSHYVQAICSYLRHGAHASGTTSANVCGCRDFCGHRIGPPRLYSARRDARGAVAENVFKYYHEDNKNLHRRNPLCLSVRGSQ
jgi:hypothetical protein